MTLPTDNTLLIANILPIAQGIGWLIAMADDGLLKIRIVSDLPDDVLTHLHDAAYIEIARNEAIKPAKVHRTNGF